MKKFIALVLSLIMTFAVASPAYAISNGYAFVETSVLANRENGGYLMCC